MSESSLLDALSGMGDGEVPGIAVLSPGAVMHVVQFAHLIVSSDKVWDAVYAAIVAEMQDNPDGEAAGDEDLELPESTRLRKSTHDNVDAAGSTMNVLLDLLPALLTAAGGRRLGGPPRESGPVDNSNTGQYL